MLIFFNSDSYFLFFIGILLPRFYKILKDHFDSKNHLHTTQNT